MTLDSKKVSSNSTGLSYAEEIALGRLPTGAEMTYGLYSTDGDPSEQFVPGSGPPLSGMSLAFNATTEVLTIAMVTRAVLTEFYVRVSHIRGGVTIATNVGAYVSDVPGAFTSAVQAGHARRFHGGPINTVENVTLTMNLSAVVFQQGDEIIVEVSRVVGYTYRSYRMGLYQATAGGIWRPLEPNEYDNFGGEISTVARAPINVSRQRRKGTVTDIDASGGFNQDVTQNGLTRLMQGFCFADAHEKASNLSLKGTTLTMDALTAADGIEFSDSGEDAFRVGNLVKLSGFVNSGNNGIFKVTAITGDKVAVTPALVNEATIPAGARIEVVGQEFLSADISLDVVGNECRLISAAGDFRLYGLNVGEWIFLGDDTLANRFANNVGYARIKAIQQLRLTLEEVTWTAVDEGAGSKTIRIYFGTFIRNEKQANLIKCKSYHIERTLGYDDDGIQSEILVGAIPNEYSLNFDSADKLTADLSFVGLDIQTRKGNEGLLEGTRLGSVNEDAFNTSSDIYQMRLYVHDDAVLSPASLFGYVLDGNLTINNNVKGLKAIGTLGSFDINVGDFEVGGELNCYFDSIEAVRAVRNNSDVGFNMIAASGNAGIVWDIPLLSLGGGRNEVEKDEPIMLPLESMAAENSYGYTLGMTYFAYLPDLAMAE